MLIDFIIASALAISGMLALLVFGTEIVQMNAEARDYWHAQAALSDLSAEWYWAGSPQVSLGDLCSANSFSSHWCDSMPEQFADRLPNWCARVIATMPPEVEFSWGLEGCDRPSALTITRSL